MKLAKSACRWLSSGLISAVVSCVGFACLSLVYEVFELQRRTGVDDDVCSLGLALGPALIVVIHRAFHGSARWPIATLAGGLALSGLGLFRFLSARAANARHVSSGPFSGVEHVFGIVFGAALCMVALLAVTGAVLAIVARRGASGDGADAEAPRASPPASA